MPKSTANCSIPKRSIDYEDWKRLVGNAVALVGSQEQFKREATILRRLVNKYGVGETEAILEGARILGWTSLLILAKNGTPSCNWARETYWQAQKSKPINWQPISHEFRVRGLL